MIATVFVFGSSAEMRDHTVLTQVEFTDGEMGWMAEDPTRPGCVGYGAKEDEAKESLARARAAYDLTKDPTIEEELELFSNTNEFGSEDQWRRSDPTVGVAVTSP